ncbi:hypothetical protein F5141DRAFT_1061913 [Pisolithus sp. B1]|nr:hypothetical protein F5141DRAFT_1061913 [Pisolithus sp. B1]
MPPKSSGPKASWNEQEVSALIHYLHQHQAEAGDNGNFKSPTYNTAADHITQYLTSRPPKTAAMVRNKFERYIKTSRDFEASQGATGIICMGLEYMPSWMGKYLRVMQSDSSAILSGVRSSDVQSGQATIPTPPSALLSSTSAFDLPSDIPPSSTPPASLRKNSHSCHSQKVAPPLDPVKRLQSSINQLTTLITTLLSSSVEQASITRSHVIQLLDGEDSHLPRSQKAFIWSLIVQSLGFADVYLRMTDKEDWVEYVNLEYWLKFGSSASQAG